MSYSSAEGPAGRAAGAAGVAACAGRAGVVAGADRGAGAAVTCVPPLLTLSRHRTTSVYPFDFAKSSGVFPL